MNVNIEPVKSWFGYSRRERRSSFILLLIILIIISVRFIVPERTTGVRRVTTGLYDTMSSYSLTGSDRPEPDSLFHFNPNTVSYDTLIKLGLDTKTAATLVGYRNKGGKFRYPEDLRKVYGIDSLQAEKLIPFVEVTYDAPPNTIKYSRQKQKPLLDINSCDSASLVSLPGIGPVLSSRIIKFRRFLGGFARIDQLKEVYGLPLETYNIIALRLFADTSLLRRINVNSAGYSELTRLPYLEKYEATSIIKYRELNGKITSVSDLIDNKLITAEKADKAGPYMRFE